MAQRLELHYSQKIPADASEHKAEMFLKEFEHEVKELREEHEPTPAQEAAARLLIRWGREHEAFGLPLAGGLWAQPMIWRRGMDLVSAARSRGERRENTRK